MRFFECTNINIKMSEHAYVKGNFNMSTTTIELDQPIDIRSEELNLMLGQMIHMAFIKANPTLKRQVGEVKFEYMEVYEHKTDTVIYKL